MATVNRTVFVTGKDAQMFSTSVNQAVADTENKGHVVVDIKFNSTCEQGQTEYSALLLIEID